MKMQDQNYLTNSGDSTQNYEYKDPYKYQNKVTIISKLDQIKPQ